MVFMSAFKRMLVWQDICQLPWKNRRTLSLFSSGTKKIEIILRTHFPHASDKA